MLMRFEKVKGGKVTTKKDYEEIFADDNKAKIQRIRNVNIQNMGKEDINVIINDGDEIILQADEVISLGDVLVGSIVIKEKGSIVRYIGVE